MGGNIAGSDAHRVTAYKQDKREELQGGCEVKLKPCKFCVRMGHGENLSLLVREKKCPDWKKECNQYHAKGNFKSLCPGNGFK